MNVVYKIIKSIVDKRFTHSALLHRWKLLVYIIASLFRIYVNVMNVVYKTIESILNTSFILSGLLYIRNLLVYIKAVIEKMFHNLYKACECCIKKN